MLGDAEKRARYDRFGHAGVAGASRPGGPGFNPEIFGDFSDILGDFFGFGGGGGRRGGPARGADLRFDLEIAFDESFTRHRDDDSDPARGELRDVQGIRRGAGHVA